MTFQKRHLFKFLFLIYFPLYVISPLCYAGEWLNEDYSIGYKTRHNVKNIQVVGALVFLNFFQQKDDENSQSNVYLMIKKPCAVLAPNTIVKLTHSVTAVFSSNNIFFSLEPLISLVQSINSLPEDGYYLSFSGLSPLLV
ncbi:MAG: hypothetical protein AB1488_05675 [Nitrospirota bacterium]